LSQGHFTRYLSRMRSVYRGRLTALAEALEGAFGRENIVLQGRHTGLHLLLTLKNGPGEENMVRAARQAGVALRGLSQYYMEGRETCPENTVVLGYASLQDEEIPALAEA